MDPKLEALLTAANDAVIVITTLADDAESKRDLQTAHWARHRKEALDRAIADITWHEIEQMSDEQVRAELVKHGIDPDDHSPADRLRALLGKDRTTIRETPDFPEDPEDSPFAAVESGAGGPPAQDEAWWINLGDGEGFTVYDTEAERNDAASTLLAEALGEARDYGEWPDDDFDSIHSWTMGTMTVTHTVKPTGSVIEGTETPDYAWTQEASSVVTEAFERARAQGFLGRAIASVSIGDDRHELHRVTAAFEDGETSVYIVAADRHDGGGHPTMLPLSEVVHVVQNLTEAERWAIGGREVANA